MKTSAAKSRRSTDISGSKRISARRSRSGIEQELDAPPLPRARLIATARRLFCAEGVLSVGIDRVLAESGVAKMTLYNYFPSKDQLIVACLMEHEREFLELWEKEAGGPGTVPAEKLRNLIRFVAKRTADPTYKGCFFLNTAHAFPKPDHPARHVAVMHKQGIAARISQLCKETKAHKPETLARHLILLMNGAQAIAGMLGRETQLAVVSAGEALLQAQGV